jgi:hypothetical protein
MVRSSVLPIELTTQVAAKDANTIDRHLFDEWQLPIPVIERNKHSANPRDECNEKKHNRLGVILLLITAECWTGQMMYLGVEPVQADLM